jgi:hypothetical protein
MRGELPSQEHTTSNGNSRWSSVCLLARIEWNNRGQPETPARRRSRVISLRRLAFFQPIAVLAAARYCGAATTSTLLSPRSRRLHRGSVAARERSGNYESRDLRDARPLAPGYSFGSFPIQCPPSAATAFTRVSAVLRSDSAQDHLPNRVGLLHQLVDHFVAYELVDLHRTLLRFYIAERISGGKRLRTTAIAASLGCSKATVKRELDVLRNDELIEFIGPSKSGDYHQHCHARRSRKILLDYQRVTRLCDLR